MNIPFLTLRYTDCILFPVSGGGGGGGGSVREKVNAWIHSQLESFLERWVQPDQQHPALEAVRKLTSNVEKLNLSRADYLEPLKVCGIVCVLYVCAIPIIRPSVLFWSTLIPACRRLRSYTVTSYPTSPGTYIHLSHLKAIRPISKLGGQ